MLMHAMAPNRVPAPDLYARYSWVKELNLTWEDLGGISYDDIGLLVELVNIETEQRAMKERVAAKAGKR